MFIVTPGISLNRRSLNRGSAVQEPTKQSILCLSGITTRDHENVEPVSED